MPAWKLLELYARGHTLSEEDVEAMQVGLYQFWRRERRYGFGASVQDREDVVQDLMLSVLERKWPGRRLLTGAIETITPALLAQHLQFWLRRRLAKTSAEGKNHQPLPDELDGEAGLHDNEVEESSEVTATEAYRAGPSASSASEDFEKICYVAARKCVADLDHQTRRIIDFHLGAGYLDDTETNQKLAAHQLSMTAVQMTRALRRLGMNQPRRWKAAFDQNAWRRSLLGRYLIDDCKIQSDDPESLEIAVRTLAWCNREHLRSLIP